MCLPGNSVLSSTKEDHQNKLLVTCYLVNALCFLGGLPCPENTGHSPDAFQRWPTVYDTGPTFKQHWVNAPCFVDRAQWLERGALSMSLPAVRF